MTSPEKTWQEFADEGIWDETEDDKIICPFCKHEHYAGRETMYVYEFVCKKCKSIMGLEVKEVLIVVNKKNRDVLEIKAQPLVDNRKKEKINETDQWH